MTVDDTISPSFAAAPSSGTLVITGDLTLAPTATVQLEIGGLVQGTQYDLLSEAGTAALTLQGTLSVSLINGFVPAPTDTFTVISSNQALNGMFANVGGGRVIDADGLSSFVVQVSGDNLVLSRFSRPGAFLSGSLGRRADLPCPPPLPPAGCLKGWIVRSPRVRRGHFTGKAKASY